MYGNGKGVPQNYVQAHMWFNLAAARFPASDAESMNQAVQDRDLAASRMTPEQIGEAQKLAREWKPK
jgi:TPR repeat protein